MFNTKLLTIFVILGCARVNAKCSEETGRVSRECLKEIKFHPDDIVEKLPNGTYVWFTESNERFAEECLEQYDIIPDEVLERLTKRNNRTPTIEEVMKEVTPEKYGCIYACMVKKKLGDKKSIKNHITDSLNEAETKYTKAEMDEIRNTVENCTIKAKGDECKLFECLEPWQNQRINNIIVIIRNRKVVLVA